MSGSKMYELVKIGWDKLVGEIIKLEDMPPPSCVLFQNFEPNCLTFLGRSKVPIRARKIDIRQSYLVSKDGLKRENPFRAKLNKSKKLTTVKFTSTKV